MGAKNSTWIAGAAFVAILLMAGTWFFGVSPIKDEITAINERTDAAAAENVILEARLNELSTASAKLPELKQELADLQVGIPSTERTDEFLRRLDELQTAYQIPAIEISVADPTAVVDNLGVTSLGDVQAESAANTAPDSETETPDAEATASSSDAAATTDAAAAAQSTTPAGPDNFYALPVTITLLGGFPNSLQFLSDLQADDGRLFLVTGVLGEGQGAAEAADGKPATQVGDIQMEITGNLYILVDPTAALGESEAEGELPSFAGGTALGANG